MIKLKDILFESEELDILKPRRSGEERTKNYLVALQKQIQNYIKNGSKGSLDLSYTPIQALPDNLTVGGSLYLRNTPLAKKYTREQLKQLLPGVKGRIGNV